MTPVPAAPPPAADGPPSDDAGRILSAGAQAERTRLSWNRTALAIAVNAALLTHASGTSPIRQVAAFAMLAAAIGCFVFADRRYRQINRAVTSGRTVAATSHSAVTGLFVLVPSAVALAAILAP